jgi:hypothetical protein
MMQVTRVLCGGGCVMLLACAAASVAVAFIRHHHRQQEWIKITAIVQLAAGKYTNFLNKIIPSP